MYDVGTEWPFWLHGVEVVVVGLDDLRGHDPAHEEDGPWRRRGQIESQVKISTSEVNLHAQRHTNLFSGF